MGLSQILGASSLGGGSMMQTKGIDRRYTSIKDIREPQFKRDLTKNEANIIPDKGSTIKITTKK